MDINEDYKYVFDIKQDINNLVHLCYDASKQSGWWNNDDERIKELLTQIGPVDTDVAKELFNKINNLFFEVNAARNAQKIALIHSEVSEALEADRKNLNDDKLPYYKGIVVEFADTIIRICDLVGKLQEDASVRDRPKLDLGSAIVEKLQFNLNRPDHKPENRAKEGGKKY